MLLVLAERGPVAVKEGDRVVVLGEDLSRGGGVDGQVEGPGEVDVEAEVVVGGRARRHLALIDPVLDREGPEGLVGGDAVHGLVLELAGDALLAGDGCHADGTHFLPKMASASLTAPLASSL